jgi:hypothetical protein
MIPQKGKRQPDEIRDTEHGENKDEMDESHPFVIEKSPLAKVDAAVDLGKEDVTDRNTVYSFMIFPTSTLSLFSSRMVTAGFNRFKSRSYG